jgi:hypothetical protein
MDERSGNVQSANSYSILRTREAALRQFSGAMDESSGNVQSANSYSILRTREAALRQFSGAMDESSGSSKCKHTKSAVLSWILQPSKFATPLKLT